jgi:hypothetical protein
VPPERVAAPVAAAAAAATAAQAAEARAAADPGPQPPHPPGTARSSAAGSDPPSTRSLAFVHAATPPGERVGPGERAGPDVWAGSSAGVSAAGPEGDLSAGAGE